VTESTTSAGVRRSVGFDLSALQVGVAEYEEGPTGCTVLALDRPAALAVDVRGGAPVLVNCDLPRVEAVCLAGGSALGVAAASGVADELYVRRGRDPLRFPLVAGGAIYDFAEPGRTGAYPDVELGRAALSAARPGNIPVGRVGAGRAARCGKLGRDGWSEPGGQGAAFATFGGARIVVVVVVNALGVVVDRDGRVVRGNRDPVTGTRAHIAPDDMEHGHRRQIERFGRAAQGTATTLTVVVTDARLSSRGRRQLTRQVHTSMARAIHPFHCPLDGDALWLLSTHEVSAEATPTALGTVVSELAWDAVLTAVR
jgi:L-aminopeptidase/D-esterase-like protein